MAKKQAKKGEDVKINRSDVVAAGVETLKGLKSVAGAKVTKVKVEDDNRVIYTLDNGFQVRARVKASRVA